MIKYIEVTGKTEDEAIANALKELGLERDEISVEILERPKSGFLGIGGCPAKIKATYEAPDETEEIVSAPAVKEEKAPVKAAPAAVKAEAVPASGEKAEKVQEFLAGLFQRMGVEADVTITNGDEGALNVELAGENMGALIGRRGETLDAIQHLANYAVNRGEGGRTRINIDAENYRAKRSDSLKRLAEKVAAKVVKYRRNITLEPMNAYERHVIHTALQEFDGVTTFSTGNEPNRRVVVAYEKGTKTDSYSDRNRGGRRSSSGRSSSRSSRPAPKTVSETPVAPAQYAPAPEAKSTTKEWF